MRIELQIISPDGAMWNKYVNFEFNDQSTLDEVRELMCAALLFLEKERSPILKQSRDNVV